MSFSATYIGQNLYIRPNYIVSLPEFDFNKRLGGLRFKLNQVNLKVNKHKGKLSAKAQKDLKCCVNWLVAASKLKTIWHAESKKYYSFKVNFITLTLPDTDHPIDDVTLKKDLLNPLLTTLRKGYGLKNYIWKLEFQQNGKLHVHLTTDTFIYWKDIRRLWNKRLIACGHMARFIREQGHSNPNSTDVHAVYKIKDVAAYLAKYVSKNDAQLGKIKGRIWYANYELSQNCKPKIFIPSPDLGAVMPALFKNEIVFDTIKGKPDAFGNVRTLGEIFFLKPVNWLMHIKGVLKEVYAKTCWNIRNLRPPSGFDLINCERPQLEFG